MFINKEHLMSSSRKSSD